MRDLTPDDVEEAKRHARADIFYALSETYGEEAATVFMGQAQNTLQLGINYGIHAWQAVIEEVANGER